jgi:hypothetical protein
MAAKARRSGRAVRFGRPFILYIALEPFWPRNRSWEKRSALPPPRRKHVAEIAGIARAADDRSKQFQWKLCGDIWKPVMTILHEPRDAPDVVPQLAVGTIDNLCANDFDRHSNAAFRDIGLKLSRLFCIHLRDALRFGMWPKSDDRSQTHGSIVPRDRRGRKQTRQKEPRIQNGHGVFLSGRLNPTIRSY